MTNGYGRPEAVALPGARMLATLVLLAGLAAAPEALAVSGEREDTIGTFRAQQSTCSTLRNVSGTQGDLFLVCNADRTFSGDREACDIYSLSTLVRGDALGFCADSFGAQQVRALPLDSAVLETTKTLRGTTFGANLGLQKGGPVDVVCATFSGSGSGAGATQGDRVCVEVFLAGPSNVPGQCTSTGGKSIPVSNSATACNAIEQQLKNTITGGRETPFFSHALFFEALNGVGGADSKALFVCNNYSARCADETGATQVEYWNPFGIFETPGCGMTRSGYRCW